MILEQLEKSPETIIFKDIIAYIDENYDFTPTKFTNGNTINEANQNNGSCKVFSFAKQINLSKEQTLTLFGEFYREDVQKSKRNRPPKHQKFYRIRLGRNFI
jgi:DNA-binding IscR family transcriptional regulator